MQHMSALLLVRGQNSFSEGPSEAEAPRCTNVTVLKVMSEPHSVLLGR